MYKEAASMMSVNLRAQASLFRSQKFMKIIQPDRRAKYFHFFRLAAKFIHITNPTAFISSKNTITSAEQSMEKIFSSQFHSHVKTYLKYLQKNRLWKKKETQKTARWKHGNGKLDKKLKTVYKHKFFQLFFILFPLFFWFFSLAKTKMHAVINAEKITSFEL